ncbi:hypothetical protein FHS96_002143 [Sphingomonas zeicaulis]|uniref:DUF6356 family protein n=1 Tax=Sphingomonas zeicaulis TaxID=1632740 RepID=UPI003D24117F
MFRKLFLAHPADVGESYGEHLRTAGRFGLAMIGGGTACLIHAIVPAWFATRGSDTIATLHRRMVATRARRRAAAVEMRTVDYVI